MEHLNDSGHTSRDQKSMGAAETTVAPRARQGTKLRDMLMSDKPNSSYADFHHEITRNLDDTLPKYAASQQRQVLDITPPEEDELVRYMSNLPSYLEKGKNFEERPLNVGVLDWRRLEKWRYNKKQMPHKHNVYSPSSSRTSIFSTDGSSTHSSRGQSCSPARQRSHRLSTQSPMEEFPKEGHVQDAKSSPGRSNRCSPSRHRVHIPVLQSFHPKAYAWRGISQDIDVFGGNFRKFQDAAIIRDNHLNRLQNGVRAQLCEGKESDLKSGSEMEKRLVFDKYEVVAPWKGKVIKGMDSTKEALRLQGTKLSADLDLSAREKSGAIIMPRDLSENRCCGVSTLSNFTANRRLSVELVGKTILERNNCEHSVPSKDDTSDHSERPGSCSLNSEGVKSSSQASYLSLRSTKRPHIPPRVTVQGVEGHSQASHMSSFPGRMLGSPSRSRNIEEKKPVAGLRSSCVAKPSDSELAMRKSSESIPKTRNPSPIRRLSSAMGKIIKSAASRDNSPLRRSNSKDCVVKSESERAVASVSVDYPSGDKLNTNNNRGTSSPLRRLFDPLLKSKASDSSEPSEKHSSSAVGTTKSRNEQLDFCHGHPLKAQPRSATGNRILAGDPHHNSKMGSMSLQALLKVSFKNGLPLFTFAIDNETNILAATMRESSFQRKGHHSWTYTFFNIREIKRKSGIWLNQGGRGDGHGYVPNVVAQMKVSDSHGNSDDHITREFDLFAVDVGHGDQYATDVHPTNELAAIIIKLPRITAGNPSKDGDPVGCLKDKSHDSRFHAAPHDNSENQHFLGTVNLSTLVILPGGVHTVPSKGEISTLAQRWRSGGSCDCGGWDLGCQLRVYTDQRMNESTGGPSKNCLNEDKFQLFSQVGQDSQQVLSLAPFKERIYSVEFNSTLSHLQAFAICISLVDCRRTPELSEPSNLVEKFLTDVDVFEVPIRVKTSNHLVEAPVRYVSYPPHSPVGRV